MAENSKIEWTDHTFNPWSGCTKVSPACEHCYAEVNYSVKMRGVKWGKYGNRIIASDSMWKQPLKWNRQAGAEGVRKRVFCASLADVFEGEDSMPQAAWLAVQQARGRLFSLIEQTPHLDWLLLTKRPENVVPLVDFEWNDNGWPPNVWIGTTVENQEYADKRIPELLKIPAKVRFLSVEPLLGPVDLDVGRTVGGDPDFVSELDDAYGSVLGGIDGIDWVIAGGESGPDARPSHPDWFRSIRDQCTATGVPFFFKQWGEWVALAGQKPGEDFAHVHGYSKRKDFCFPLNSPNCEHAATMYRLGKKAAGRLLDGRTWDEYPQSK